MSQLPALWATPKAHLAAFRPDAPVLYVCPAVLQATARRFLDGFPGLVTYAVKANDAPVVLENLVAAGLRVFDVASPAEMAMVRAVLPSATLHYNNPVRSEAEIAFARAMRVASYAVDDMAGLHKIARVVEPGGIEISVRIALNVRGAAYDFGSKFGATEARATEILKEVARLGFEPAMTFHPGTQCADPAAWQAYIGVCARVAKAAGVILKRLNVGGGYAAHRTGSAPNIEAIFAGISCAVADFFGADAPALVCEPGRAMVADAWTLGTRVKALREDGSVFLNDGIYGGLAETVILGSVDRIAVLSPSGSPRGGAAVARVVFGPTCDSLDRLRDLVALPGEMEEGDFVLFGGMGAYSTATATRFNGYGALDIVTVAALG